MHAVSAVAESHLGSKRGTRGLIREHLEIHLAEPQRDQRLSSEGFDDHHACWDLAVECRILRADAKRSPSLQMPARHWNAQRSHSEVAILESALEQIHRLVSRQTWSANNVLATR